MQAKTANIEKWSIIVFSFSALILSKTHQLTSEASILRIIILEALRSLIELIISLDKALTFERKINRESRYLVDIVP